MSEYTALENPFIHVDGIRYLVKNRISWKIGNKNGPEYFVPGGYVFDVSIPKWLRWAFSPNNPKFLKAGALHDRMLLEEWDRLTAAAIFHQALKADGVVWYQRFPMWLAVSLWKYE